MVLHHMANTTTATMTLDERWSLATALGFAVATIGAVASALGLVLIKSSHATGDPARRRSRWLIGTLVLCTVNPVCDVVALCLAPLSLLAPLGAIAVIASLILGHAVLHERPSHWQWALASVATLAVALASLAGPHEDNMPTIELLDRRLETSMFVSSWLLTVLVLSVVAMALSTPRMQRALHNRAARAVGLMTAFAAGATGSVTALAVKMALHAAVPLLRGEGSLVEAASHSSTRVAATMLAPAAIGQMVLLNAALSQGALAAAAPVYQVTFSLGVLLNGALLLNETNDLGGARLVSFGVGVGIAATCSFALGLLRAEPEGPARVSPLAASDGAQHAECGGGDGASDPAVDLVSCTRPTTKSEGMCAA